MVETDFKDLSSKEQRLAIANDVIEQLALKKIEARTRKYLRVGIEDDKIIKCQACAKGSALVSYFKLNEQCLIDTYGNLPESFKGIGSGTIQEALKGSFDADQLDLMEIAFERGNVHNYHSNRSDHREAVKFGNRHGHPKARLEAIMQNIIDNDGEFVP